MSSCSFQDFGSLQDGGAEGGSGGGAGDTGSAGGDSSGGGSNSGGSDSGGTGSGGHGSGGTGSNSAVGGLGGVAGGPSTPGSLLPFSVLDNGSFETGSTDGWTVVPASAIADRHVYVEPPTGTVSAPDGVYQLASWHGTDSYELTISQQVDELEDGTYTLQGYFMRGPGLSVEFFARNCSAEDPAPLVIPATSTTSFTPFTLSGIEVEGGSCEVGLSISAEPGRFMNADVITLTKE